MSCLMQMPRTHFSKDAYENPMAQMLWGRLPVERAAALMYYVRGSGFTKVIHRMKYGNSPDIGIFLGRLMAEEMGPDGFFDGIDLLVPVPLTKKRQKERGYNQSAQLALGVSQVTGIPVAEAIVVRTRYDESQTHKSAWERQENVENAFELVSSVHVEDKHILLIDDVITTGATIINCGNPIAEQPGVKISVLTVGFTSDK